ncbi:MAG: DUF177 domain-containing protein [Anaerolineales bacterium]|nr:DUF177 domain-containing protein [Anaerolineales bacterium]
MVIKKNDPYRLDISYLIHQPPGTQREFELSYPFMHFEEDFDLLEARGKITVSVTDDGVLAAGRLEASTQLECTRCLEPYLEKLEFSFTELYTTSPEENEDPKENHLPQDGFINLKPLIRDYGMLEVSLKHLCREDCRGLCSVCGGNLNEEDCGHVQEQIDPRMAKLKQLLDEEEIEKMQGE